MKMQMSLQGLQVLKRREACRLTAYQDGKGVWTIGWGHTKGVTAGIVCSLAQAEQWLREDIAWAEEAVNRLVKVSLAQSQFDALVSLMFNIGETQFAGSTLLKELNAGHYQAVPGQIRQWNKLAGQVCKGLENRREEEVAMWEGRVA